MSWIYEIKRALIWKVPIVVGSVGYFGYSGHETGKNNPAMQDDIDVGPIPVGNWLISTFFDHPKKGPIVARLTPLPETNVFGRSAFMIHGDSIADPGEASLGCIILAKPARIAIRDSNDYNLEVISGEETAI